MKTPNIRFNLKFYGPSGREETVRTLADLREKCNLSDLYDYFKEGVLERWLVSIGEQQVADSVRAIQGENDVAKQITQLIAALSLECVSGIAEDVAYVQRQKNKPRIGHEIELSVNRNTERPSERCEGKRSYCELMNELSETVSRCGTRESWKKQRNQLVSALTRLLRDYDERFLRYVFDTTRGGYGGVRSDFGVVLVAIWSCKKWRHYIHQIHGVSVVAEWDCDYKRLRVDCPQSCVDAVMASDLKKNESAESYAERMFGFGWED